MSVVRSTEDVLRGFNRALGRIIMDVNRAKQKKFEFSRNHAAKYGAKPNETRDAREYLKEFYQSHRDAIGNIDENAYIDHSAELHQLAQKKIDIDPDFVPGQVIILTNLTNLELGYVIILQTKGAGAPQAVQVGGPAAIPPAVQVVAPAGVPQAAQVGAPAGAPAAVHVGAPAAAPPAVPVVAQAAVP